MKKIIDGSEVTSRSYYYLLEWNDNDNSTYIYNNFNKVNLSTLTLDEYKKLFSYATQKDLKNL